MSRNEFVNLCPASASFNHRAGAPDLERTCGRALPLRFTPKPKSVAMLIKVSATSTSTVKCAAPQDGREVAQFLLLFCISVSEAFLLMDGR